MDVSSLLNNREVDTEKEDSGNFTPSPRGQSLYRDASKTTATQSGQGQPVRAGENWLCRNSQPWSAGGYSLPIPVKARITPRTASVHDTNTSAFPMTRQNHPLLCRNRLDGSRERSTSVDSTLLPCNTRLDDGNSSSSAEDYVFGHRYAESQGSIYSYGSSYSGGHSRSSSVTTVSDSQSVHTTLTEAWTAETKLATVHEEPPLSARILESSQHNRFSTMMGHVSEDKGGRLTKHHMHRRGPSDVVLSSQRFGNPYRQPSNISRYVTGFLFFQPPQVLLLSVR